jgi:prophage antirepressor-like protein
MKNVQVFDFKQNAIRATVDKDNNPLFVARDVALALGYARPADAVTQHCKNQVKSVVLGVSPSTIELVCIYEPDLYRLIFGSKLDSAIAFQDWIFNDVLPSIRKTGGYSTATTDQRIDRLEAELKALKHQAPSQPIDSISEWLLDYLDGDNFDMKLVSACDLWRSYLLWCDSRKLSEYSRATRTALGLYFKKIGFLKKRNRRGVLWVILKI